MADVYVSPLGNGVYGVNIAIIRFSSLGDLVTLEPTFRALRHFYPDANITFITSSIGRDLFKDSGYFDAFVIGKSKRDAFQIAKKLRATRYDMVINLQSNTLSFLVQSLLKKERVVYKSKNFFQKYLKLPHKMKDLCETLLACGIDAKRVEEYCAEPMHRRVLLPAKKQRLSQKKCIAIAPGSSPQWISKQWGEEKFAQVIERLIDEYEIVLIGAKAEEDMAKRLAARFGKLRNYVGKTNLQELKNLIASCDLFIGNDSGPTQIAAGVGTPVIAIFLSTSTKHLEDIYTNTIVKFAPQIECAPCYKKRCPTNYECRDIIAVEKVVQTAKELLGEACV